MCVFRGEKKLQNVFREGGGANKISKIALQMANIKMQIFPEIRHIKIIPEAIYHE